MQNSKFISIAILVIMLLYFLFSQIYLTSLGSIFVYIINPLFFIIMAIIIKFRILSPYKTQKYKKPILHYIIRAVAIYSAIYILSGLFLTYGNNPYSTGLKGTLLNLYSTGVIIFCREFIRFKVINNVYEKDKKMIFIMAVIVFTIQECSIFSFFNDLNIYYVFKNIFSIFLPSLIKNVLFTYIEQYSDYWPSVIYELAMYLLLWIPPILPNAPWVFSAIIDCVFPILLLLHCIYFISSKDKYHIYRAIKAMKPKGIIPLVVGIVLVIWFAIGIFPIKPIAIASGSMEPEFSIGDLVILKKCNVNEVEVGEIIEYKRKDFSVVHRVVAKNQIDGRFVLTTKGDNNNGPDADPVQEEQIVAKAIAKIPYIAWPTIWIENLRGQTSNVDVEMGK